MGERKGRVEGKRGNGDRKAKKGEFISPIFSNVVMHKEKATRTEDYAIVSRG
jgi:hypothetical protein